MAETTILKSPGSARNTSPVATGAGVHTQLGSPLPMQHFTMGQGSQVQQQAPKVQVYQRGQRPGGEPDYSDPVQRPQTGGQPAVRPGATSAATSAAARAGMFSAQVGQQFLAKNCKVAIVENQLSPEAMARIAAQRGGQVPASKATVAAPQVTQAAPVAVPELDVDQLMLLRRLAQVYMEAPDTAPENMQLAAKTIATIDGNLEAAVAIQQQAAAAAAAAQLEAPQPIQIVNNAGMGGVMPAPRQVSVSSRSSIGSITPRRVPSRNMIEAEAAAKTATEPAASQVIDIQPDAPSA